MRNAKCLMPEYRCLYLTALAIFCSLFVAWEARGQVVGGVMTVTGAEMH